MKNAWETFVKNKIVRVWTVIFVLAAIAAGCHDDGGMLDPTGPEKVREPLNKDSQKEIDRKIWEIFDSTGVIIYHEFDDEPYMVHTEYMKYRSDTTVSVDAWYSMEKDGIEMWEDSVRIAGRAFKIGKTSERQKVGFSLDCEIVTEVSVEGDSVHLLELIVRDKGKFFLEPWDNDSGAMAQIEMLERNGMLKLLSGNRKPHTIFLGKKLVVFVGDGLFGQSHLEEQSHLISDFELIFGGMLDDYGERIATLDIEVSVLNGYETPRFDAVNFPGLEGRLSSRYLDKRNRNAYSKEYYLEMILSTSYEDLCGIYNNKGYNGYLSEAYGENKNGWVRKGYDALMADFKEEYGIDLSDLRVEVPWL